MDRPEAALGPDFAIHPRYHDQRIEIRNLVRRDKAGADGRSKIFALGGAEPTGHFLELHVARAKVIHDRVAGDVPRGLPLRDIPAFAADDTGKLQFVIQFVRLQRPGQVLVGADDRAVVSFVIDRRFVPFRRNRLASLLRCRGDVLLNRDEVP